MHAQPLRKRLAELDAQICDQKRVLGELQKTRSNVERELHATATFPVLILPTEITAEIFVCCFRIFEPLCIPKCAGSAAITLGSVCRAWRDIVLATPILWSELKIRFDHIGPRVASKPFLAECFIYRWLGRAGNRPLQLDFHSSRDKFFTLSRLRDIIHRWSHRVQYLHLDIRRPHDIGPLGLGSTPFPLLQGATFGCNPNSNPTPIVLFGNAPRLRDLSVQFVGFTSSGLSFPWLQLTKFEGRIRDLGLFTLAPNLIEAKCTLDNDDDDFLVIAHGTLTSLTIGKNSIDILQYLTLPALRYLDVSNTESSHSFKPFLARSSPPLASLSIRGDTDRWRQCIPLVARTLNSLEIARVSREGMVTMFSRRRLSFDPLSNIQTLSLKDIDGPLNLYDLVGFLYSRSDKLRKFRLVWGSSPFLDGMTRDGPPETKKFEPISSHLSRLTQAGMDIYLGTADKNYVSIGDADIGQNSG
ncbi:hypothetical protein B0H12DRAFT_370273 [Mycena haematopus]|nr:hypothetical protein B0H12DRAFT_370273 [Mycena haematopus]